MHPPFNYLAPHLSEDPWHLMLTYGEGRGKIEASVWKKTRICAPYVPYQRSLGWVITSAWPWGCRKDQHVNTIAPLLPR